MLGIISKFFTITILLCSAFLLISSKTDVVFGFRTLLVLSGSMEPDIKRGDIIIIRKAPFYYIDDVITFSKKNKNLITHRIKDTHYKNYNEDTMYRVKGDANASVDPDLVNKNYVLGKIIIKLPILGKLTSMIKNPVGFIGLIVTPSLYFIFLEMFAILNEIKLGRKKLSTALYEK